MDSDLQSVLIIADILCGGQRRVLRRGRGDSPDPVQGDPAGGVQQGLRLEGLRGKGLRGLLRQTRTDGWTDAAAAAVP